MCGRFMYFGVVIVILFWWFSLGVKCLVGMFYFGCGWVVGDYSGGVVVG